MSIRILLLALLLVLGTGLLAQNSTDNCGFTAGAEYPVGTSCSPLSFNKPNSYTSYMNPGTCNGGSRDDAWGWFTATGTQTTVTYDPPGSADAILHVFSGTCGSLVQEACADDFWGGGNESVTFTTTPGTDYLVRVQRYNANNGMNGGLCIYTTSPPANDDPCGAISLGVTASCAPTGGDNSYATATAGVAAPSCSSYGSNDVWFTFVAPAGGAVTIETSAGTLTDGAMAVYTAASCSGSFTQIGCDDDSGPGFMPELDLASLAPGQTYHVRVWGYGGAAGSFDLCVVDVSPPANDEPCGAFPLTVSTSCSYTTINNRNATESAVAAPPCGGFIGGTGDVWYSFVAPASGMVIIETVAGSLTNADMALYEATSCGGTFQRLDCDDASGPGSMPFLTYNRLIPGDTYYLRVWGWGSAEGDLDICLRAPALGGGDCTYVLELFDTGENGWGSSRVGISLNGGAFTWHTTSDRYAMNSFSVNTGDILVVQYDGSGPSQNQNRYTLRQMPSGDGIHTNGPYPITGVVFTETVDCIPPPSPQEDCEGGRTICGSQSFNSAGQGIGFNKDLDEETFGCLSNSEREGLWYFFSPSTGGNVAFTIAPNDPGDDYDFAVWGPLGSATCPPADGPLRCSYAAPTGNTGLNYSATDDSEGAGGDKWVNDLTVSAGEVYILYVSNWSQSGIAFSLNWDLTNGASLDCTVLPIELISFDAQAADDRVDLRWSTATEKDNAYFEVQRSTDGADFITIGTLAGAGTTSSRTDYFFPDMAPIVGMNYYRLKQVDHDGTSTTTEVRPVLFRQGADRVVVFPNPVKDQLGVAFDLPQADDVLFRIVDLQGRVWQERPMSLQAGPQQAMLDAATLPQGPYLLQLEPSKGGMFRTIPFIRN